VNGTPILTEITFVPLVGAIVIGFLPARYARPLGLATALVAWGLSLLAAGTFQVGAAGFQFKEQLDWIPAFGIQYKLGVDGISLALVVLTTTLTWISILASFKPIQTRIKEYMVAFLILEVGMLGVFLALDTFLFYIFWEVVLVPMYLIIGIWGGANRIYATIKFVLYTLVGSLLMLVAILATAFTYQAAHDGSWAGAFDFEVLRQFAGSGFSDTLQLLAFAAFFLAFAIKVPMFPFHTWLPDAHVEAPTAGSVILAGILLKLGGYGFMRFSLPMFPAASHLFTPLIFALSVIAVVYTSLVAFRQLDIKKLIAYSSVAHMGFVTMGIFSGNAVGEQGALFQMLSHGVISGALFLCVGVVYDRMHTREIAFYGGLVNRMPMYAAVFLLFTMGNVGLPGTSGFVGEILTMTGTYGASTWTAILAATGVILSAVYALTLYRRVIFGELTNPALGAITDLDRREMLIFAPLVVSTLVLGVQPGLVINHTQASVDHLVSAYEAATGG
jgi:NADH-quinone oxidoreductase subunit M